VLETIVLKALLSKDSYNSYRNYLKPDEFTDEGKGILKHLDKIHKDSVDDVPLSSLAASALASMSDPKGVLQLTFASMQSVQVDENVKALLEKFKTTKLLEELSVTAYEASLGKKNIADIVSLAAKLESPLPNSEFEFVNSSLQKILLEQKQTPGLRWRLKVLNKALGSLRVGDFGFFFARPEVGKSCMLASEVGFMGTQLKPDAGPIIYFNNEEQGGKMQLRMYQSVLGKTVQELEKNLGASEQQYINLTQDKIKIKDSAVISRYLVEAMCEKFKPSLIVFDQLDKIDGFYSDREDIRLGKIYIWARELAKRFCPVIGVCQADATGEGQRYLSMANVANSKTGKTAEADFIVGIGSDGGFGQQNLRGLAILKNKLIGDDQSEENYRHFKGDVLIRAAKQQFEDI